MNTVPQFKLLPSPSSIIALVESTSLLRLVFIIGLEVADVVMGGGDKEGCGGDVCCEVGCKIADVEAGTGEAGAGEVC